MLWSSDYPHLGADWPNSWKVIERVMRAGEQQTMAVRRELMLTVDDGSALTMTINGAAAKPLGPPGQGVTARLDLMNFKDYLSAR